MKNEFVLDGICYVMSYVNDSFSLHIDVLKSDRMSILDDFRSSDDFAFGGEPPVRLWYKTKSSSVFTIKSKVLDFIESVLTSSDAPYFFKYGANEPEKLKIYRKIAHRICCKYGYYCDEKDSIFRFYKV